jgi:hypothetical protein
VTKHFLPTTFCEYDEVELHDEEGFVLGISIFDVGTGTSHRYRVSGGGRILLTTDVLNHACDAANNIVDGFFRAGFEVVK